MDNKAFDRDEGNVVNNNKQMQVIKPMNDKDYIRSHGTFEIVFVAGNV